MVKSAQRSLDKYKGVPNLSKYETRADVYAVIIKSAHDTLCDDPLDTLYRQVSTNISGGHPFWDDGADDLFNNPKNLDEALLALELRKILEIATKNQLQVVLQGATKTPPCLDIFGVPMDFGITLSSAIKLAGRNPLQGLRLKLNLAQVAHSLTGQSLAEFIAVYCVMTNLIQVGEKFCDRF